MNSFAPYSVHDFKATDTALLAGLLAELSATDSFHNNILQPELPADMTIAILQQQQQEYSTGLGYIKDDFDNVIGVGGLHFLQDVKLFEVVCYMLPEYRHHTGNVIGHMVDEAIETLCLDKLCARTLPASLEDLFYKENGFMYSDERAFAEDGMNQIWNYYELDNEANISAVDTADDAESDWDSLF